MGGFILAGSGATGLDDVLAPTGEVFRGGMEVLRHAASECLRPDPYGLRDIRLHRLDQALQNHLSQELRHSLHPFTTYMASRQIVAGSSFLK
ncbi:MULTISPECIES: hypothetical protein [Rhizobium]|uniref:hypothetical protein n=1 Tax=Rhizobium TaxID=379 RepID=UPI00160F2DAA|nr:MULTISPECIES: hypothetical protein [Rhizobium]MBB6305017.1 hypothetical protein [Rhizobium leucaenae]MDK4743274.1 hypothetical protein [Rhizobium sp. CNPSo 3464]